MRHLFFLRDPSLLAAEMPAADGAAEGDAGGKRAKAPEWVNVMPEPDKDGLIFSRDNRVLHIDSMEKLARRSNAALKKQRGGGLVDRDHETYGGFFMAGGGPAVGWAEEFEARPGKGMWARTEWLPAGEEAVATRQYRYTSSVMTGAVDAEVDEEAWSVTWHIYPETIDGFGITNIPALVTTSMFSERSPEQAKLELLAVLLKKLGLSQDAELPEVREAFIRLTRFTDTSAGEADPATASAEDSPHDGNTPPLKKDDADDAEGASNDGEAPAPVAAPASPASSGPTVEEQLATALARIKKLEGEAGEAFVESLVHAGKLTPAQRKAALAQAKTSEGLASLRDLYEHAPRIVAVAGPAQAAPSIPNAPHGVDPLAWNLASQNVPANEIVRQLVQQRAKEKTR